eukprot:scaffold244667_cov32-Prasinocladus_malaysianus.AAC.1
MTINYRSSIIQVRPIAPAAASPMLNVHRTATPDRVATLFLFSHTYARTVCNVMFTLHVKKLPQHESPKQPVKLCQSSSYLLPNTCFVDDGPIFSWAMRRHGWIN